MATIGRTLFRFGGAVLLGASATSIDNPGILDDASLRAHARVATVPVVLAAKDLPEGAAIDRTALVVALWPAGTQPVGAYANVDSVAGRVTRVPVYKGEALVPGRLAAYGTPPGVAVKITPGKRAFGIRVDAATGMPGLVQPNSRVDVLLVINDSRQGKPVARLFMENMRVLAIGQAAERADYGRPVPSYVATIEVTVEEAERLAVAAPQGSLQLVLRGYDAIQQHDFATPMVRDLLLRKNPTPQGTFRRAPVEPARPN